MDFVRDGMSGHGALRKGSPHWRRLTERRCGAKSVFHFDVPGSVAKSTHAGLPWLLYLRRKLAWPRSFLAVRRMANTRGAIGCGGGAADGNGSLQNFLSPELTAEERALAKIEGWILGIA